MNNKLFLIIAIILFTISGLNAQKIYEFDELNQLPFISESDMEIIALSIVDLYKEAILNPEQYSVDAIKNDTVFLYYDEGRSGKLSKFNPVVGEKYSKEKHENIAKNNELLFNLIFDENGYLNIPSKIDVISYDEISDNGKRKKIGILGLELTIPKEYKIKFSQIKLENVAAVDKNSLTGNLSPVSVIIPFNLTFYDKAIRKTGTCIKESKYERITNFGYQRGLEEYNQLMEFLKDNSQLIEFLKDNSELMDYKKGEFEFTIEEKKFDYYIDVNIARGAIISAQPHKFVTTTTNLVSFTGEGKKIKQK